MRDISEYKLLGNYLVRLYQKYGVDQLKYENVQEFTSSVFSKLNNLGSTYNLLPIEPKVKIVQNMINKGVFRTNTGNKLIPFKQVYKYEVSRGIYAIFGCDKTLTFKIMANLELGKENQIKDVEEMYCRDIGLDIQKEINAVVDNYKMINKIKIR